MSDSPTTDFLAREHAILGDDAALFGNTFAQLDTHTPIQNDDLFMNGFDSPDQPTIPVQLTNQTQSQFTSVTSAPVYSYDTNQMLNESSYGSSSFPPLSNTTPTTTLPELESEVVKQWRLDFAERIAEKESRGRDKHARILKESRDQLDAFYAEYNEKKMKQIQKNKQTDDKVDEKVVDNVWKKVYGHIDAGGVKEKVVKGGKDVKKDVKKEEGGKDKSRMKALLIALKNDPRSPGNPVKVGSVGLV